MNSLTAGQTLRAVAAAAGLALMGWSGAAVAQDFPTPPTPIDRVTGLWCFDTYCGYVRLPQSNCICQKLNPGEMRLSRVKLECVTKEGGQWVACPVRPPFGN